MKKLWLFSAGIAFVLAITFILHAQTSSDDLQVMEAAVETTTPTPATEVPESGTFYSAQNSDSAPSPADLINVPVWSLGDGFWLLDDLDYDYTPPRAESLAARRGMSGMSMMDDLSEDDFTPAFSFPTNSLWLQITNVSDGLAYVNLMNATDSVYEIFSKTDLTLTNWTIEQEVFPTSATTMPFVVPESNRTNLFIWARDWTGITSDGNETPEWWFYLYFGTVDLADNDLDANGDTLLYDYTNNIAPNDMTRTPMLLSTIAVTDPVDLKCTGTNLYVLSGSTATLTEFNTNGTMIRSLSSLGSNPSGFDVDALGNVYVAVTGGNQVWKFNPTTSSFSADTNFGFGGFIGATNGATGTTNGQFNAPYDVAISPDGGTISVSDSGNNRIQQFLATNGMFITTFGVSGSDVGQFNAPKGLTYDGVGNLYIADSGNGRIVLANDSIVLDASGEFGTVFGQFSSPANVSVNDRGIYVADTGNNRIQCFNPLANGVYSFALSDLRFAFSTNFSQPFSVAAVDNLTNEMFYVADTGNNRVLLYSFATDDPTPAWTNLTAHVAVGDISGAALSFCNDTTTNYQQAFTAIGTNDLTSDISSIGALTPVYIKNDAAEYYFEKDIEGHTILFPVEFMKENGVWKIISF